MSKENTREKRTKLWSEGILISPDFACLKKMQRTMQMPFDSSKFRVTHELLNFQSTQFWFVNASISINFDQFRSIPIKANAIDFITMFWLAIKHLFSDAYYRVCERVWSKLQAKSEFFNGHHFKGRSDEMEETTFPIKQLKLRTKNKERIISNGHFMELIRKCSSNVMNLKVEATNK